MYLQLKKGLVGKQNRKTPREVKRSMLRKVVEPIIHLFVEHQSSLNIYFIIWSTESC